MMGKISSIRIKIRWQCKFTMSSPYGHQCFMLLIFTQFSQETRQSSFLLATQFFRLTWIINLTRYKGSTFKYCKRYSEIPPGSCFTPKATCQLTMQLALASRLKFLSRKVSNILETIRWKQLGTLRDRSYAESSRGKVVKLIPVSHKILRTRWVWWGRRKRSLIGIRQSGGLIIFSNLSKNKSWRTRSRWYQRLRTTTKTLLISLVRSASFICLTMKSPRLCRHHHNLWINRKRCLYLAIMVLHISRLSGAVFHSRYLTIPLLSRRTLISLDMPAEELLRLELQLKMIMINQK